MNSITSIYQGFHKIYMLSLSMFSEIRNSYFQRASVSSCLHTTGACLLWLSLWLWLTVISRTIWYKRRKKCVKKVKNENGKNWVNDATFFVTFPPFPSDILFEWPKSFITIMFFCPAWLHWSNNTARKWEI